MLRLEAIDKHPLMIAGLNPSSPEIASDELTREEVEHHMEMLFDADFIESGSAHRGPMNGGWYFKRITWAGRDFLDSVREEKVWTETKSKASKAGGFTIGILTEIAKGLIKGELTKFGVPFG